MLKYACIDASEVDIESKLLDGICEVECYGAKTANDIPDRIAEVDIVAVWHAVFITKDILEKCKNAKMIVRMGVGYDNVDIKAAGELGIPVCNVPDYGTEEVADSALGHILSLYRQIAPLAMKVANGAVIKGADSIANAAGVGSVRIRGRKLGLVGFGRIGQATAIRAKAFGLDVLFYDPWVRQGFDKVFGVTRVETLKELFQQSHCISLHCNCTKENTNFINAELFGVMQKGSFIVNTARGELIDEQALLEALQNGTLAGAGLDVHHHEPFVVGKSAPLGTDGIEFIKSGQLVCTPHNAWYSVESRLEMRTLGVKAAKTCIEGKPLQNCVNAKFLKNSRSPILDEI